MQTSQLFSDVFSDRQPHQIYKNWRFRDWLCHHYQGRDMTPHVICCIYILMNGLWVSREPVGIGGHSSKIAVISLVARCRLQLFQYGLPGLAKHVSWICCCVAISWWRLLLGGPCTLLSLPVCVFHLKGSIVPELLLCAYFCNVLATEVKYLPS